MQPVRLVLARLLARPLPPLIAAHVSQRIYSAERGMRDDYPFRVRSLSGSSFVGTTQDPHACMLAIHGYFDWRLQAVAAYFCRPGDTIVEVGANIGTETIRFADTVGPQGHVYAFEPDTSSLEQLRRVLDSAAIRHVVVIPAAVSDAAGTVTFCPSPNVREPGMGHIQDFARAGSDGGFRVECVSLDSYFEGKGPVHHMFIDAEGAEVMILRGGREILRRDRPVVVVEAAAEALKRLGFELSDLKAELESHDYRVYAIERFGLTEPIVGNYFRTCNWLALPPPLFGHARKLHRYLLWCGLLPCVRGLNPLTRRRDTTMGRSG